eukprot:tig00021374_g21131.t1
MFSASFVQPPGAAPRQWTVRPDCCERPASTRAQLGAARAVRPEPAHSITARWRGDVSSLRPRPLEITFRCEAPRRFATAELKEKKPEDPKPEKKSFVQYLLANEDFITIAGSLAVAFFIRTFICEPRFIPSLSMYPGLDIGDHLFVEKVSLKFREPHRGEVVVFEPPQALVDTGYKREDAFIKRVIGTPGSTVSVHDGRLYVDGVPVSESYVKEPMEYELKPITVPEGSLLVFGDNRNNSFDSHVWGFLPEKNLIGRAVLRFWPLPKLGVGPLYEAPIPADS